MTERFDSQLMAHLVDDGHDASAVAYFHSHRHEVAALCRQAERWADAVESVNAELTNCHAHRFDLDYGPEKAARLLERLGLDDRPAGGPDNFYNGVEFVGKRIDAVIASTLGGSVREVARVTGMSTNIIARWGKESRES